MCGIFGYISFSQIKVDKEKFNKALTTIIHRGPDSQNSLFLNNDTVALGHVRLAIIDLSESGNQPMAVGKYQIIFNGEIFNYIELREELLLKGYVFNSNSDTEVLVNAYDCWGEDCVSKFNGMWAFAIFNTFDRSLFCSRDRFGVKPFNYYIDDNRFIFGSEVKPIINYDSSLRKPNFNSIGLFCREGLCGELSETWFDKIFRLKPGHNLILEGKKARIYRYYNYPEKIINIPFDDAKEKFSFLFNDAVKLRMRSDVPVGTTLSGGLDSTSIVSALRQFHKGEHFTFTAHFPGMEGDEYAQADRTNKYFNLSGTPVVREFDNKLLWALNKAILHLESGHFSPAILPLWRIHGEAKKKVKVVLEGQGADELLGGYIQHVAGAFLFEKIIKFQWISFIRNAKKLFNNYSVKTIFIFFFRLSLPAWLRTIVRRYFLRTEQVLIGELKKVKHREKTSSNSESYFTRVLQHSHQGILVSLLHYGDAISMAFGIESRLPFMDYRLVDFVMTLPADYLVAEGKGKYIQRESLRNILPAFIYEDIQKLGFVTPINDFFSQNRELVESLLLSEKSLKREIFDEKELRKIINSNYNKSLNRSYFLFRLLCVELWFKMFIDDELYLSFEVKK
ncbi:MAG: asparagine synthase (glutamine-hydrolyzing) [Chitinophagaceae bacterium]|nr:asparagine synthase (glutamine-hydrolyzing) [Chitinophagaceae bacterium]